jgi:8-oxo-dGTP diphosphatase
MEPRVVHVAVGVILDKNGNILIAKRPDKTHQGGLWEFPGGKVERGETLFEALKRELYEELAIEITTTEPLIKIRHDYGDKIVLLDVHKVTDFSGNPHGNEGQPVVWVAPEFLHEYEFPAANRPIITAINLPQRLLITGEFIDADDFLKRIESALKKNIRLVQLRLQNTETIASIYGRVSELCDVYSAKLLINASPEIFSQIAPDQNIGLHLNSKNLLSCNTRPVGKGVLLSASCHDKNEIEHAQNIGVDFICISPVLETKSHPDQPAMGWHAFEQLVVQATVPVYALGGMKEYDVVAAVERGAQGIAAISEWWEPT